MRLGALLGPIVDAAQTRALATQARALVDAGYTSLWTAQAIGRGFMMSDPFVTLAVAATITEEVELGTAVVQVPLYAPADLAHRVFSLMQIAGPRLRLGIGAGSTGQDFVAFGRPYDERFRDFTDRTCVLRAFLRDGRAGDVDLTPWPAVQGGPPVLLGSWGKGVERAAQDYDGWIASGAYRQPNEVIEALGRYRRAGGGRAIVSTLQLGARTDVGELRERLARFAEAGFDDAVVMFLPGGPRPEAVRRLL
jgi:alkanesulfonate monooxygenase SsuD/methylene tetrahydromethanopterin reductase-like flavin-dependent oxidoreductase (luciferase family)